MATAHPRLDALKKRLEGLRWRVFWVLLVFSLGTYESWSYRVAIIRWLIVPAHGRLSPTGGPVFIGITDVFDFAMQLAILGGVLAAAPVVALQLFLFLNPLLGRRARRFLAILLPSALVLFLVGVVFSYVAVLPLVLNFMLGFGADAAVPMIGFDKYMQEAKAVLLGMGLVFETPLLMFLFARFRILSCRQMAKVERWVPGVAFLIAGSISNTVEVSIPIAITVLFELGLFLAWITEGADWRRVDWRAVALRAAVVAAVGLAIAWWRFPAVGRFVLGLTRQ